MVGSSTPNSSAMRFWSSQKVSDSYKTSTRTASLAVR